MIQHYFKIAIRNLLKYKMQTLISIIGLAIGFTCFALSNLWIRYEMTYDNFHEGADRMYILYQKNIMNSLGYSTRMQYPVSTVLEKEFPEVEAACAYTRWKNITLNIEGQPSIETCEVQADSCFMKMFNVSLLTGSMDFMYDDNKIALTEEMAMRLFGTANVLGKTVKRNEGSEDITVCALLKSPEHSNLSFGFWGESDYFRSFQNDWMNTAFHIIIKLRKGINPETFQKKLSTYPKKADQRDISTLFENVQIMPLTKFQYSSINEDKPIEFHYLILFSLASGLLILCSIFNYLSLFVTRMNMRSREFSLRKVCGSSTWSLFTLLALEYTIMIFVSGLLGMTFVEVSLSSFRNMSGVSGNIYGETVFYFIGILLLSLLLLIPFILRYTPIKKTGKHFLFRKCNIVLQLIIGILFIFCISIIMKQLYYLKNTDLGWERKNIAAFKYIYPKNNEDDIANKTAQMPCTSEVLTGNWGLLPRGATMSLYFKDWEEKPDTVKGISIITICSGEELVRFYNLRLLAGEMLKADDVDKAVINETAAKAFGMNNPVGKKLYRGKKTITIIGLIKDFHTTPPTIAVEPVMLVGKRGIGGSHTGNGQILIKYHDGKWNDLKMQVDSLFAEDYPNIKYTLVNVEDVYAEYLKSDNTLLKLLSMIAVVCIMISSFGILSFVTLCCEQRRKEIAIRKVNGATIKNILGMIAKEYLGLLAIASIIAFPIGYVLMKQ